MRYRKTAVFIVVLLMLFSLSTFARTQKLRTVNRYPLMKCKAGVASVDDLRSLIKEYAEDIKVGFEKADASFLYADFMDQADSMVIEETFIPMGEHFEWMLFRTGRKVKAVKDLDWAGKKTLDVYKFVIQKDCKDYHFFTPKPCGNIALVKVTNSIAVCDLKVTPAKANIGDPITVDVSGSKCAVKMEIKIYHPPGTLINTKTLSPSDAVWETSFEDPGDYVIDSEAFNADGTASKEICKAKVYINYPPVCDLKVSPIRSYTGLPFKLDASGSSDKDGKVVKADFTITNTKDGSAVDQKSVTSDPLEWTKKFKKSGIYKVDLKVTDDFNAVSKNVCESTVEVQKRMYFLVEGGPMVAKGTYSGYLFARLGFAYLISPEKFSLVMSAGGALTLAGDPFKSHFLANALLNAHFGKMFIGAGVGYHSEVRPGWDAGLDIVGNLGFDIYEAFNKKASIFAELRVPTGTDYDFSEAHEILLGFRFLF